jgi:quercetin dioxygenase-like cupin family protein
MIVKLSDAPVIPLNLEAKILQKDDNIEIIHLCLKKGEELSKHDNPFDVIFYVLEGYGELIVKDDKYILEKDNLINVKAGTERTWTNIGNDDLKILVIKNKIRY